VTYFENSSGTKRGTPRSTKTCDGKVVVVDGIKYKLKALTPTFNPMKTNQPMWQSIENAPKNLNQIILYCGEFICMGRWSEYYKEWEDDAGMGKLRIQPSHWMPIPEPPSRPITTHTTI